MHPTPQPERRIGPRTLSFVSGAGMVAASVFTIRHFFEANYPESIFAGSVCDINAFFNCDSSAYSNIAAIAGVPIGYFGLMVGALVMLGAVFPSNALERSNKSIALLNVIGVISLFCYTVFVLGSLCLYCTGYYLFSILSLLVYRAWRSGPGPGRLGFLRPSLKHLVAMAVVTVAGAYGMRMFHEAKKDAQTGVAMRAVSEYYSLPETHLPSLISPYWTVRSTERFEDAPIQVIEYADPLCPDCLFLAEQLAQAKEEFAGKLNIAFQFFPLEAACNDVVEKDLHPGACAVSLMLARDTAKFPAMIDEVWANFQSIKRDTAWRADFARRHGVEDALTDPATADMLHRIIETGSEYEKTSDQFAHGIRSTPTMILNNRMVIGTMPYPQLRAIFEALVREKEGGARFMEDWVQAGSP
ncbi:MAG: vitamin K epoxide reductase family protein [Gemmatimonadota bacterium]|jgi:uncharacterized membrane protein/protein-disulfide isomerase